MKKFTFIVFPAIAARFNEDDNINGQRWLLK